MKLVIKKSVVKENSIVYNLVVNGFGVVVCQEEGYNVMYLNDELEEEEHEVVGNFLVYTVPQSLEKIKMDSKPIPEITIE